MPAQHGQTFNPNEEPPPRGGWFRLEERPHPERLERAFWWAAAVVAIVAGAITAWLVAVAPKPPVDAAGYGLAVGLTVAIAALAYGFTRAIGMIAVGIYGTLRDGSEFVVDWRALRHDLPLRRTRVLIIEAGLLIAALVAALWGLGDFYRHGSIYGLAMFVLIFSLIAWPDVRRWIQKRPAG